MGKVKKLFILFVILSSILFCQQKQNLNSFIHPQADKFISKQLYNKLYYNQYNSSLTTDSVLTKVGQWGGGPCYCVAVKGNYAYIGNGLTLQVLDVSNTGNPKVVGELLTNTLIRKVVVSGNYAYTISPFQIIDISNPTNPVLVSTVQPTAEYPYPPTAIIVQGNYAYVGDFYGFVVIIDVSDPSNPQEVGRMLAAGEIVQSIVIKDTILYATTYDSPGMDVFSISNPYAPYHIKLAGAGSSPGSSMAINNHYLYLGTPSTFLIFDISDLSSPRYINGIAVGSDVCSISVTDTIAYIIQDTIGLTQIDISDTNNIRILSIINNPFAFPYDDPYGGLVGGTISYPYAYIASGTGLWIVNIEKPDSIRSVYFFPTGWYVNKIVVDSSDHAFLAELHGGLKILDFSDPSSPKLIAHYLPDEQVIDVAVDNNFAYLLCDSDLQVLDVTDLASPKLFGKVPFNDTITTTILGNFDFLYLYGSTIYAARKSQKLFAIDIGNPNDPQIRNTYGLRDIPVGISRSNNYIYVADSDTGIQIFNTSNPNYLVEDGFLRIVPLRGLAIEKNKLFVIGWEGTELGKGAFAKYDIINPLSPTLKYMLNVPGGIMTFVDIKTEDHFAYLAYNNTLLVVSITNPDSGQIIYSGNVVNFSIGSFNSVAVSNGVVLTGSIGILLFKNMLLTSVENNYELPKSFKLFQNYPNPFNPSTSIKYQLPSAGYVTLTIYDVLGRKMETLVNSFQNVGNYAVKFSASKFSSGVYFYQVEANANGKKYVSTKKMVLLK